MAQNDGANWNKSGGSGTGNTIANGIVRWNTSVTTSSRFTFGSTSVDNVLPVHFSNVKVSEKSTGIHVEFTNLTEFDLNYYEVERAPDGKTFSAIKRIYPMKNNYGSATYAFLDINPKKGRNTYRIRAVETSGKVEFSSVVSIMIGSKISGLSVYANGGQVAFQIGNLPAGKYRLQFFSAAGQLMKAENITHAGGTLNQTTALNNAKAGIYILNISGAAMQMQQKFLV